MFFKTRKMLLIFLSSLAAVSIALVPHNKIVKEYITNNYWYNKSKLEFYEVVRRQGGHWFTNYDLILEFQNPNGQWEEVKRVDSINSNNELLEYKPTKSGTYRYVIKKYKSVNFSNSFDDLLAVTHVVRND